MDQLRKYSKQQLLGGSLDIMSDCISFCVAPALMIFAMFEGGVKQPQYGQSA